VLGARSHTGAGLRIVAAHAEPSSCNPQVAALGVMVDLAGGAQAGLLGCGWPAVLRTLSNLAALQVRRAEW
jgi:hypothetical protein